MADPDQSYQRRVRHIDGVSFTLADTPANRAKYDMPAGQAQGCGFPVMSALAVRAATTGAFLAFFPSNWKTHDFRLFIATTLLDTTLYPASRIRDLYQGRWKIEESFRDLKDSMNYGFIRSRSPASVIKTLKVALIAHNLVRAIGATAAHRHRVLWERISFKGATVSIRLFLVHRLVRDRMPGVANFKRLLVAIATDLVEERPGRREPRAVKKRAKPYPLLTCNRHEYEEIPHRSRYQKSKESAEVSAIHACPLIFA